MGTRDGLTLAGLILLIGGIAWLSVRSHHMPQPDVPRYAPGLVLSYEVRVSKAGGTRGVFDVRLDEGATLRVMSTGASSNAVPGGRVCVRTMRQGDGTDGWIVPMDRWTDVPPLDRRQSNGAAFAASLLGRLRGPWPAGLRSRVFLKPQPGAGCSAGASGGSIWDMGKLRSAVGCDCAGHKIGVVVGRCFG